MLKNMTHDRLVFWLLKTIKRDFMTFEILPVLREYSGLFIDDS
jgi:hypothetical protein